MDISIKYIHKLTIAQTKKYSTEYVRKINKYLNE